MRPYVSCLVLLLWIGCAAREPVTVAYDVDQNATAYETQSIPINTGRSNVMGLQGRQQVILRVTAACPGTDCTPEEFLLVFANTGEHATLLNYETLTLDADGENYEWMDLLDQQEATRVPPGDFLRLPVDPEAFARIATSESVSGSLGGTPFRLTYDQRAPLRALLATLDAGESPAS